MHPASPETTLETLLERSSLGDEAAFRDLYDRLSPRLFGVAHRITRQRALAADAVQEAFLQIWRNARRFDPTRGSAETWTISLVRYRALDLTRRAGATDAPLDEMSPLDSAAALNSLADADAIALRRCLELLEPERRSLVLLSFVDGFSHSELATRTETPLGTIKSWIRRSLEALRSCLSN